MGGRGAKRVRRIPSGGLAPVWAHWVLWLYPHAWRERFAEEMADLLSQVPITPWTLLDLLLSAVDAHLHVELLPEGVFSMASRLRSAAVTAWCAFAVFALGVVAFGRMTDPQLPFDAVAQTHPGVRIAWAVAITTPRVAGLAVLVGGVPMLVAAVASAWRQRRRDILALFAWPAVGIVCCGLLLAWAAMVAPPIPPGARVRPVTGLFAIIGLVFVLVAAITGIGGTISVAIAVSRSTLSERLLRFVVWPAAVAVAAMTVTLVATLVWAVLLWQADPRIYGGVFGNCTGTLCDYGPTGDIGVGGVAVVGALLLLAVAVGAAALRRALTARALPSAAA